jgi:copper(I)-binding protein
MKCARFIVGLVLGLACWAASAHGYKHGAMEIRHPCARATAPGQTPGGCYLKLNNAGAADSLLAAMADVCGKVELHAMSMDGTVMRMRQVEAIKLPTVQTVMLEPSGLHILFVGPRAPLKVGESFPLRLRFEKAGEVTVEVRVEASADAHAH